MQGGKDQDLSGNWKRGMGTGLELGKDQSELVWNWKRPVRTGVELGKVSGNSLELEKTGGNWSNKRKDWSELI